MKERITSEFSFEVWINNDIDSRADEIGSFDDNWIVSAGDLFDGRSVGSLAGVGGMAAVAGTLITTWLVPAMTTESYGPIFILVAALVPLSLLSIWLIMGRIAPVQAKSSLNKDS